MYLFGKLPAMPVPPPCTNPHIAMEKEKMFIYLFVIYKRNKYFNVYFFYEPQMLFRMLSFMDHKCFKLLKLIYILSK